MDEDLPGACPRLMWDKGQIPSPDSCGIYQYRIVGYGHRKDPENRDRSCLLTLLFWPRYTVPACPALDAGSVPGFAVPLPSPSLQAGSSLKTSTGSFLYAQPPSRKTSPESSSGQALRLANRLHQLACKGSRKSGQVLHPLE